MKSPIRFIFFLATSCFFLIGLISLEPAKSKRFHIKKDLLLANYDCKTDVDDLHSVAGLYTLLSAPKYKNIKYHAVAGTYGTQKGLYVPANELFQLAFGDHWSDAHTDRTKALEKVFVIVKTTLENKGDIWIAEAGQSDFSEEIVHLIHGQLPHINTNERVHIVQHSDWNEKVTTPESLAIVKQHTDYYKIPDGNAVGNGSPGFREPNINWEKVVLKPELKEVWKLASDLGLKYNGKEKRYHNEAVAKGGLDFSDTAEVCWILGLENIQDAQAFFSLYAQ